MHNGIVSSQVFKNVLFIYCVCVCRGVCGGHVCVAVREQLVRVGHLHHVGPRHQTLVIKLGSHRLHPLSHLASGSHLKH